MSQPDTQKQEEFVKVVADILQLEMDLKPDQILLYNTDFNIPADDKMYLSIGILGDVPFAASHQVLDDPELGLVENQGVNVQEIYSLLIYSKSPEARLRRHEPPMILRGVKAQQQMEKYSFKIGYLPTTMNDVSEVEGTYRLSKYSLTFRALVAYARLRAVEYFDTFTGSPSLELNP
jgi:hypothetical protein